MNGSMIDPTLQTCSSAQSIGAASAHLVLGAAAADEPEAARRSPSARQRGLTTSQLQRRQRSAAADMDWLLRDSALLGLVEQGADGRWRLTPDTERRFGDALRNFSAPNETLEGR